MEEREINLLELWLALKKNIILDIVLAVGFALIMFIASNFFMEPIYESSTSLIVKNEINDPKDKLRLNDIQLNQKLMTTYADIIKSRGVADIVIENLDLDLTYEELSSKISVNGKNDSQIFEILVKDSIPQRAVDIANETSKVFIEAADGILNINNIKILDKAVAAKTSSEPNTKNNTIKGFLLGFILGIFVSILQFLTDTSIKSSDDLSKNFDIQVIGRVPFEEF